MSEFKIAKEKYEYCLGITEKALRDMKVVDEKKARILLKWVEDYKKDAEYYFNRGDFATALEAIAYAHGFIDSAVLLGLVEIKDYHLEKAF